MPHSLLSRRRPGGHDISAVLAAAIVAATLLLALGLSQQAVAFAPSARLAVALSPGSPAPPVLNQGFSYSIEVANDGDVPLDNVVIVDTVPVEMTLTDVTTGGYTGLTDFAAGEGVRVSYEKNTALGVFTLWGSSPNTAMNTRLTAPPPGLGAGEYITRVRWEYGQAAPGMQATTRPALAGRVTNPDNAGGPVAAGDQIMNCASLTSGAASVTRNACRTFTLIAGPAVAIETADSTPLGTVAGSTATLTGGDPTGSLTFTVFAASDSACATPLVTDEVTVGGAGSYESPDFTAVAAGAYKWVARYAGDAMHAAAATGCGDPAGAFAVVAPPALSASFGAATIAVGESTALNFAITNPPANTVPLTGVALENALPAGLAVASPNGLTGSCGAGTITAVPGSHGVTLAGGTIPVGSTCSFSVNVTASAPGTVTTTTGAVLSENGGSGESATASLTVTAPPAAAPVPPGTPAERSAPATPVAPRTAQELALACSPENVVLLSVTEARRRVRFRGAAAAAAAGSLVTIRTLGTGAVAARATVLPDGSFEAFGRRPVRRLLNRTRYLAELGDRRSPSLKLTRRLTARLSAGTISGRVTPPLGKPVRPVVLSALTSCGAGYQIVARVKPGPRGRFRVTLPRTPHAGPALYLAQTQVRTRAGGAMRTFSLVLGEPPA